MLGAMGQENHSSNQEVSTVGLVHEGDPVGRTLCVELAVEIFVLFLYKDQLPGPGEARLILDSVKR